MTRASALHRLVLVTWLTFVWVTLWGSVTLANVGGGLLVAAGSLLIFPPAPVVPDSALDESVEGPDRPLADDEKLRVRPLSVLALLGWFLWALVESTWHVAVATITPARRSEIHTQVVDVPLASWSPVVTALVANAITLTPGTLTLEARGTPATLTVHGMFVDDPDAVRADVWDIERRVVAAVGTRRDRALLAEVPGRARSRTRDVARDRAETDDSTGEER